MKSMRKRLQEFASINEMYVRGFPMGKLENFIEQELKKELKKEREEIVEMIKEEEHRFFEGAFEDIINTIKNRV